MKDINGKTWSLALTIGAVKRVREHTGVDLCDVEKIGKGETFEELGNDLVKMVNVCYLIVKPQADDAGITDEQFGELVSNPETLDQMVTELIDSIVNFIPNQGRRKIAKTILEKTKAAEEAAINRAMTQIQNLNLETLTPSHSNSQENVESTPGATL